MSVNMPDTDGAVNNFMEGAATPVSVEQAPQVCRLRSVKPGRLPPIIHMEVTLQLIIDSTDERFMDVVRLLAGETERAEAIPLLEDYQIDAAMQCAFVLPSRNANGKFPAEELREFIKRAYEAICTARPRSVPVPTLPPPASTDLTPPETLAETIAALDKIQAATVRPSPATNVETDTEGLPWDVRIHSASREKNKDGTWRIRRNSKEEIVAKVKAELKALMAVPGPGAATAQPTVVVPAPAPNHGNYAAPSLNPTVTTVAEAPAATAPPPPPPPAPAAGGTPPEFIALMDDVASRMKAGALTVNVLKAKGDQYAVSLGLQPTGNVMWLRERPDLIAAFRGML